VELRGNSPLVAMDHEETESVPVVSAARSMDGVEHPQLTAVEAAVVDREVRAAMAPAETESARMVSAARNMDGAAPLRLTAVEAAVVVVLVSVTGPCVRRVPSAKTGAAAPRTRTAS